MTTPEDVIEFLHEEYLQQVGPRSSESEPSLTLRFIAMAYLAEWHSAIHIGETITDCTWENMVFPYSTEYEIYATKTIRMTGIRKGLNLVRRTLGLREKSPDIDEHTRERLEHVLTVTKGVSDLGVLEFTFGTFPIRTTSKGQTLNLLLMANRYAIEHGHLPAAMR